MALIGHMGNPGLDMREKPFLMGFVVPLSFAKGTASPLLAANLRGLQSPLSAFYSKGLPVFYVRQTITNGETEVEAHLDHDERRKADKVDHLRRRLGKIESRGKRKEIWFTVQTRRSLSKKER